MINVIQLGSDRTFHLPWWIMWGTEDSNYSSNWTPASGFIKDVFSKGVTAETIPLINSQRIYPTDGAKQLRRDHDGAELPSLNRGRGSNEFVNADFWFIQLFFIFWKVIAGLNQVPLGIIN